MSKKLIPSTFATVVISKYKNCNFLFLTLYSPKTSTVENAKHAVISELNFAALSKLRKQTVLYIIRSIH